MASLITKELTITIDGSNASLDETMYIYQNDKNIDIIFTITDSKFKFNEYSGNILVESTAKYARVKVLKPNNEKFISNIMEIVDNKVVFTVTEDFTDACSECGIHKLQIQLFDGENGRVTIPPVDFTVLEPIFHDDGTNVVTVSCERVDE